MPDSRACLCATGVCGHDLSLAPPGETVGKGAGGGEADERDDKPWRQFVTMVSDESP